VSLFNRYPRGWLGFLDAKTSGQGPSAFTEEVRPTLDIYQFLYSQMRECITGASGAVAGLGQQGPASLIVPQDEIWFIERVVAFTSTLLAGAETLNHVPAIQSLTSTGNTTIQLLGQNQPGAGFTVGQSSERVSEFPGLALPGDRIVTEITARAVYAGTMTVTATFARAKV
jgi:hypothetical protein